MTRWNLQIFLAGLAAQLASFIVFTIIFLLFLYRVYTRRQEIWNIDSNKAWYNDWRALGCALVISCIGILVRLLHSTQSPSDRRRIKLDSIRLPNYRAIRRVRGTPRYIREAILLP